MSGSGQYLAGPYVTLQHTLAVMSLLEKKEKSGGNQENPQCSLKFRDC